MEGYRVVILSEGKSLQKGRAVWNVPGTDSLFLRVSDRYKMLKIAEIFCLYHSWIWIGKQEIFLSCCSSLEETKTLLEYEMLSYEIDTMLLCSIRTLASQYVQIFF